MPLPNQEPKPAVEQIRSALSLQVQEKGKTFLPDYIWQSSGRGAQGTVHFSQFSAKRRLEPRISPLPELRQDPNGPTDELPKDFELLHWRWANFVRVSHRWVVRLELVLERSVRGDSTVTRLDNFQFFAGRFLFENGPNRQFCLCCHPPHYAPIQGIVPINRIRWAVWLNRNKKEKPASFPFHPNANR